MSLDITSLSIKVESQGITQAATALDKLSSSAEKVIPKIASLEAAMKTLNAVTANSLTALNQNIAQFQHYATTLQSAQVGSANASQTTSALTNAIATLSIAVTNLNVNQTKATTSTRQNNEAMKEAHALARGLSGSLGALWLTYSNLVGTTAGLAIGASLKGIISVGKDVENTLEGIRVKGNETVETVNAIRNSVLDLGKGIYGPQEVAKAFETLILAGKTAKEALVGISDALNLATVGGTSIEKSAYTIVQVGTALGYSAENYSRIADVIAATAAASMSSVESLSEAFKSGSVVGKLYGVTLVDIGVSLAALSNLGIQGSAAGTSLKNFYKELSSNTDKVKNTLKDMKLVPEDFKDAQGNYKSLLEVVATLETGLGRLTLSQQKLAIANLSNERGMKTAIEVLDLYRQKIGAASGSVSDHNTVLDELHKKIDESYGFAAIGAAQMALTVDGQFKSVANTFKTVLVTAFQSISPELSIVSTRLKEAFGSEEFKSALTDLAVGVAKLTVVLVENAGAFMDIARAILAFKAASTILGLLIAIASGFTAVKTAMVEARIASIAFQASLGLVGLALGAAAAAMVWYSTKKDEASTKAKEAAQYSNDYAKSLENEAARLTENLRLLKEGKNARDAETESMYKQTMALAQQKAFAARSEAEARAERASNALGSDPFNKLKISDDIVKRGGMPTAAVKEYYAAQANLVKVNAEVDASLARIAKGYEAVMAASKNLEKERRDQEEKNKPKETGKGLLTEKQDTAAENTAKRKELSVIQNEIRLELKKLDAKEAEAQSQYKQGLIGNLSLIEATRVAENARQATIIMGANNTITALSKYKNTEDEIEQERGKIALAREQIADNNAKAENKRAEDAIATIQKRQKAEYDMYTAQGEFVKAFLVNDGRKYDILLQQLGDDLLNAEDAATAFGKAAEIAAIKAARAAGEQNAATRELKAEFEGISLQTQAALRGVEAIASSQGINALVDAGKQANAVFDENLVKLTKIRDKLAEDIKSNGGTPDQVKLLETINKEISSEGAKLKTMWVSIGESIGNTLEKAFGKGGKAIGEMISITQRYDGVKEKSTATELNYWGKITGSAAGFFNEQSKGYKILHGVSQAFHLAEIAILIAKNVQLGIAAVLTQGQGDPYSAFPRIAAMLAIVTALGVALSGGSGGGASREQRQATQGTGSVLGDTSAKSESIANSLSILEKNSGLGLAHSNTMIGYLRTVADGISGLANLVVRTTGITTGKVPGVTEGTSSIFSNIPVIGNVLSKLFGSSTTVKDQGVTAAPTSLANISNFLAKSYAEVESKSKFFGFTISSSTDKQLTTLSSDINNQFKLIFEGMSKSLTSAANLLGVGGDDFKARLNSFVISIGDVSLKGLTGDQIEKTFQNIFSKISDDMAQWVLGGFTEFQKVGEGYLETVSRIANELVQVRDVFAILGQTLNVTGGEAVKISQGLIAAAGGLDKLTSGTKYFIDNFLSEQEKLAPIQKSVNDRLKELNLSELTTVDLYKKKVQSLDLNVKADQDLYVALLELAPAFKAVQDAAVKVKDTTEIEAKARELDIRLMEAQGQAAKALKARRDDELEALNKLDSSLKTRQEALNTQLDLNAKEATDRENAKSARTLEIELMEAQGRATEALAEKRKDELAALTPALAAQKKLIHDQLDANTQKTKEEEKARSKRSLDIELMEAQGDAAGALNAKREDEYAALFKLDPLFVEQKKSIYALIDATAKKVKEDEKLKAKDDLAIRLLEAQGNIQEVLNRKRAEEIKTLEALDPTLVDTLKTIHALEDSNKTLANAQEISTKADDIKLRTLEAQGKASEVLDIRRKQETAELAKLSPSLVLLINSLYVAEDAATAAAKALEINNKKDEINLSILKAQGKEADVLNTERSKELAGLEKLSPELVGLQQQLYSITDAATAAAKALEISNKMYDLDIELLQARGKEVEATALIRKRELAELTKLSPALAKKKQDVYDALDAAQIAKAKEENIKTARSALVDSLNKQADAIKSTVDNLKQAIDKFKGFSESIKKFKSSLLLSDKTTLSPLQQYEEAKRQFLSTRALASGGNEIALGELENVSNTFLEASKGYFASTEAYVADFNLVQAALTEGAAAADTQVVIMQAQLSAAEAQLAGIEAEVKLLSDVKELLSVQKARENLAAASQGDTSVLQVVPDSGLSTLEKAIKILGKSYVNLQNTGVQIDGSHYNGLDYVPKDGYIAELHQGERVQTAKAASAQDANNVELVALTKKLLEKICKIEDNTGGANMQRGAAHVEMAEIMETVATKVDDLKRAVKSAATK